MAENEQLADTLRDFCSAQGINAVLSPKVTGSVNGRFDRFSPGQFFTQMTTAYGLIWYFDGNILYIYRSDEVVSRIIKLASLSIEKLQKALDRLDITDIRYPMKHSREDGILIVSGPGRYVELVADTASMLEQNEADTNAAQSNRRVIRVFELKYAWADDQTFTFMDKDVTIPGVASSLRTILSGNTTTTGVTGKQEKQLPKTVSKLKGKGLIAKGQASDEKSDDKTKPKEGDGPKPEEPAPSIQADTRLNAVIIKDKQENMPIYEELIALLDAPVGLVEIHAAIVDISSNNMRELGVDWRYQSQKVNTNIGDDVRTDAGFNATDSHTFDATTLGIGNGLNYATIIGSADNFFLIRLKAMEESGQAHVLSRPSVLTLNNTEAVLEHTQTFYIRVAGTDQVDLFNVSVGIVLKVTPHIIEDEEGMKIKLVVKVEDGDMLDQQVDGLPVIQKSTINTQATIREKESLLIGGYTRKNASTGERIIPCLGNIPFLGNLFRQKTAENTKADRFFLITPRIIRPDEYPNVDRLKEEPPEKVEPLLEMLK
jgi:type III secretion protein C